MNMKLVMKDKERFEALCKVFPDFPRSLKKAIEAYDYPNHYLVLVEGCSKLYFKKTDFDVIPTYDPHDWNRWPDLKPEPDKMLRIEVRDRAGLGIRCLSGYSDGEELINTEREDFIEIDPDVEEVFTRPWDESEWEKDDE